MRRIFRNTLIYVLITGWIFSGWPALFPSVDFPPIPQLAKAAQADIDTSVFTTNPQSHVHFGPQTVFISDQVGYKFYRDNSGECVFSKTTDGGANWGGTVIVDNQGTGTDCINISVWYDQWTPGDTGTSIHIVTMDTGSDSLFYNAVDTASSDSLLTGNQAIDTDPGASQGAGVAVGANYPTITKGTDGSLYVAVIDNSDQFVLICSTTCGTDSNWAEDDGGSPAELAANDSELMVPLPSGDILYIENDTSASDILSKVYTGGVWDADFVTIDGTAVDNVTYDQHMAATVDPKTGDVYLAYLGDVGSLGTDDDIRTAVYSGGSWTSKSNVVTNSACAGGTTCGITSVAISFDSNTGDVYVAYSAQSSAGTASSGNVYWKKSTDGMANWGSESSALFSSNADFYGVDLNAVSNERIYASGYDVTNTTIRGNTVVDLTPPTYTQSAYRFYANQNSADVGAVLADEDTAATLSSAGQEFRLRTLLTVANGARASLENFKLQFAEKSGTCDTSFTGETYADVTSGTVIAYNDNAGVADGAALTGNANDPDNGNTVRDQTYEEANNFTNSQIKISASEDGLWDFSLIDNGATAGTSYCLRIVKSAGTQILYTVVPEIITASAATYSISITSSGVITYGYVELSTASSTVGNGFTQTAENDGNATEKLNVKSSDATGGTGWTLSSAIGTNIFKHEFSTSTGATWTTLPDSATYVTAAPTVAQSGTVNFDFRLTAPSQTTDFLQKSITITVQAVAPS